MFMFPSSSLSISSQELQNEINSYETEIQKAQSATSEGSTVQPATKGGKRKRTYTELKRKWRQKNPERAIEQRRKSYIKKQTERGKTYIPQTVRSDKKVTKRDQKKEKNYYSEALRRERRIQRSIKEGMTREEAEHEAIQHRKTLRDRQRGRIP